MHIIPNSNAGPNLNLCH